MLWSLDSDSIADLCFSPFVHVVPLLFLWLVGKLILLLLSDEFLLISLVLFHG